MAWKKERVRHSVARKFGKAPPYKKNSKFKISKSKLQSLTYWSDLTRSGHLQEAINRPDDTNMTPTKKEFNFDNDYIVVKKKGNKLYFYEKWLESCWSGLMAKEENKELTRTEAMQQFVKGRLTNLAQMVGHTLKGHSYDPYTGIMKARMEQVQLK